MQVYLDNSATTMPCKRAKERMSLALNECWGNPSSLHDKGLEAQMLLDEARGAIAKTLSCNENEIYFTSGGTESNNLAVFGAAHAMKRRGKKLVTSSVEHPSVARCFDALEAEGFTVVRLPVDEFGRAPVEELEKAIDCDTVLVSLMAVNNELGAVEPFEKVASIIKAKSSPALFHVDAVQAFGKLPLNVKKIGADLMSVSSHKVHGPKGVGALFVKNGVHLAPHSFGGGQEKDVRPGTEPMPAIAGFLGAVEELKIAPSLERITAVRDHFTCELSKIDGVRINSAPDSLPYIVNASLLGLPSEAVLNLLSSRGVYASSGSACSKGHRSHVLLAAGLPIEVIDSSLRFSLSRFTNIEEIDACLEEIKACFKVIRRK